MGAVIRNGHIDLERDLHARFCELRLYGEWFKRSDELLTFIKENAQGCDLAGYDSRIVNRPRLRLVTTNFA